jgi:hypothetical protein
MPDLTKRIAGRVLLGTGILIGGCLGGALVSPSAHADLVGCRACHRSPIRDHDAQIARSNAPHAAAGQPGARRYEK